MGAAELLRKCPAETDPDLVRSMVQTFAEALMSAEASGLCNAEYGEVTPERVNSRNAYRSRRSAPFSALPGVSYSARILAS
jgi:transposase-like protein